MIQITQTKTETTFFDWITDKKVKATTALQYQGRLIKLISVNIDSQVLTEIPTPMILMTYIVKAWMDTEEEIDEKLGLCSVSKLENILRCMNANLCKGYLSAIMCLSLHFKDVGGSDAYPLDDILEFCNRLMKECCETLIEKQVEQISTEKEKTNMTGLDELVACYEEYSPTFGVLNNPSLRDLFNFQRRVIASMYLNAPMLLRNEWATLTMKMCADQKDHINYIHSGGNWFKVVIQDNKKRDYLKNTGDPIKFDIEEGDHPLFFNDLCVWWGLRHMVDKKVEEKWGKEAIHNNFLINFEGKAMSSTNMTRAIKSTFRKTGKEITCNMLRHIIITSKYKEASAENGGIIPEKVKQELADKCDHTKQTAQDYYVKLDVDQQNQEALGITGYEGLMSHVECAEASVKPKVVKKMMRKKKPKIDFDIVKSEEAPYKEMYEEAVSRIARYEIENNALKTLLKNYL